MKTSIETREKVVSYVWFDLDMMHIRFLDGREISVPLEWFPKLRCATDEQRKKWQVIMEGIGIRWEDIDEDISVEHLTCREHRFNMKLCGRDVVRNGKCIFHLDNKKEEENNEFRERFREEIQSIISEEEIDFTGFIFPDTVSFYNMTSPVVEPHPVINKPIHFENAKFKGGVNFGFHTFKEIVDISHTEFNGDLSSFSYTIFEKEAIFSYSIFNSNVDFDNSMFKNIALFLECTFTNDSSFLKTIFENGVDFYHTQFDKINFRWAQFSKKTNFSYVTFNKEVNFQNSDFFDNVDFIGTKFSNEYLSNFRYVKFHKPKDVRFQGIADLFDQPIDMTCISFLNTDITDVTFTNVKWPDVIIDERLTKEKDNYKPYEEIIQLYRRLRINFESNYKFAESGNFFIREMDMRRLYMSNKFEKLILGIYKYLGNYGESYKSPIIWAITIIFLYPVIIYLLQAIHFISGLPNYNSYFSSDGDLRDSAESFFQIGRRYLIERLIGIPILGLLLIALKRKFERKM